MACEFQALVAPAAVVWAHLHVLHKGHRAWVDAALLYVDHRARGEEFPANGVVRTHQLCFAAERGWVAEVERLCIQGVTSKDLDQGASEQ